MECICGKEQKVETRRRGKVEDIKQISFSIHYSEPRDIKTKKIFFGECIRIHSRKMLELTSTHGHTETTAT